MPRTLRIARTLVAILFLGLATGLFAGLGMEYPRLARWLEHIQLLPAAMAFAMAVFVGWMLATLVFGRVYCSTVCPLGVFQDVCARLPRLPRKGRVDPRRHYHYRPPMDTLRYACLGVLVVTVMTGIAVVATFIDPYAIFGRFCSYTLQPLAGAQPAEPLGWWNTPPVVAASASVLGCVIAVAMMALVAALAWKHGRLYCNTICPVGTTLGLVSRYSIFHIDIDTDRCTQCRRCEHVCKSECIDMDSHVVDGSRCVTCFDCVTACPDDAIRYTYLRHQLATPMFQKIPGLEAGAAGMAAPQTGQCAPEAAPKNPASNRMARGHALPKTKVGATRPLLSLLLVLLLCSFSTFPGQDIEVLFNQAQRHFAHANADSAVACYGKVINLHGRRKETAREQQMVATSYLRRAYLKMTQGRYASSCDDFINARDLSRQIGFTSCQAMAEANLGVIYSFYGDIDNTLSSLGRAMSLAVECDSSRIASYVLQNIINTTMLDQAPDSTLRAVLPLFHKIDSRSPLYDITHQAYLTAKAWTDGDLDAAIRHAKAWDALNDPQRGDTPCILANLFRQRGRQREAIAVLRDNWLRRSADPRPIHADCARALIGLYIEIGQPDSAMAWYKRYQALTDTLFREQKYAVLRDMLSDRQQQKSQQQMTAERERRARVTTWLWVAVAFIVLLCVAGCVVVRYYKAVLTRNRALFQKETERLRREGAAVIAEPTHEPSPPAREASSNEPACADTNNAKEVDPELVAAINRTMADAQMISSPDFSITSLAHYCGCGVHRVSAAIHAATGENFSVLLANARVNLASQRLRDPEYSHLTIEAISRDLGFRSRSNFATQFRRVTGLNPNEYRRMALKGRQADHF